MKEDRENISMDIANITSDIPALVFPCQNELLKKLVEMEEVEEAINQIFEGEALGPNVFKTNLFHPFWDIIKEEV